MTGKPAALVVVADADVLVRHALAEYLRNCGYLVIEAATSDEVVAVLGEASLDVDILLCDAQLGGSLGGFGLRRWIAAHRPEIDVELAGSVVAASNAAAEICENGPDLNRPYEPQLVIDRVAQLRARRARNLASKAA